MQPTSWRSRIKIGVAGALLFALIYAAVYYSTSLGPYATLYLGEETHFMRFAPDGAALLTLGTLPWTENGWGKEPRLRVWDVGRIGY